MDNFKEKMKKSKNAIVSSQNNNPNQIYQISKQNRFQKKFKFNLSLGMNFVLATTLIIVLTIFGLGVFNHPVSNITGGNNNADGTNSINEDFIEISSFKELKALLNDSTSSSVDDGFVIEDIEVAAPGTSIFPTYGANGNISSGNITIQGGAFESKGEVFQTNVQVEGVDEADIVKVNGEFIYYLSNADKTLYILKTNGVSLNIVTKYVFDSESKILYENEEAVATEVTKSTPYDLYFTKRYLILRTTAKTYTQVEDKITKGIYSTFNKNISEYFIYDINTYELVDKIQTAGTNIDTRLVDDELIIVNRYVDYKESDDLYLPIYYHNGLEIVPTINKIYYSPFFGASINSYIIIYKVHLNSVIEVDDFYFLSPYVNLIYATTDTLYLVRNSGSLVEQDEKHIVTYPTAKILIFDFKNNVKPKDVVEVKGKISDKYWIDEYDGYLRVASTGTKYEQKLLAGKYPYSKSNEVFNYLTIFKLQKNNKYEEISSLTDGLGEVGESLKSARFNGTKATLVTFRQTDPLYYIDLTDHYHPVITSELKVSGYTVYQHPYKENYVIGFGYEASESGRNMGYKIALFDVSDASNIKQVGKSHVFLSSSGTVDKSNHYYYSDYYQQFDVITNPKSLMLNLSRGLFGLSIFGYDYDKQIRYFSNYMVFKINEESDDPLEVILNEEVEVSSSESKLERMVFVGEYYYLLSSTKVYIYKLDEKLDCVSTFTLK